jgi:predicted DNA binding CopG/RHH family protein
MNKHIKLDLSELEVMDNLDDEEIQIYDDLMDGKYKSIDNPKVRANYANIFKRSNTRSRAISLRMQEKDYIGIKAKAMQLGMPYQSLINSIIHRFLTGEIEVK